MHNSYSLILILLKLQTLSQFDFSHFSGILVNGLREPCGHNSSYSLIPILLKLYRCCDHALKICMWFGYNPQINFCCFFRNMNLAIFGHFDKEKEWTL